MRLQTLLSAGSLAFSLASSQDVQGAAVTADFQPMSMSQTDAKKTLNQAGTCVSLASEPRFCSLRSTADQHSVQHCHWFLAATRSLSRAMQATLLRWLHTGAYKRGASTLNVSSRRQARKISPNLSSF